MKISDLIPKETYVSFDLTHDGSSLSDQFFREVSDIRVRDDYDQIMRAIEASLDADTKVLRIPVSYESLNGRSEQRVKKILDWLVSKGYLGNRVPGFNNGEYKAISFHPVLKPFNVTAISTVKSSRKPDDKLIIIKDKKNNKPLNNKEIKAEKVLTIYKKLTMEVKRVNNWLASHALRDANGKALPTDLHRVFNYQRFDLGGRWYAGYQSHTENERKLFTIDGEPVVQPDYQAMAVRIAYAVAAKMHCIGDPYLIEGYSRDEVKSVVKRIFSVDNSRTIFNSIRDEADKNETKGKSVIRLTQEEVNDIVEILREKHYHIAMMFFSDSFQLTSQHHDSMIIGRVINKLMNEKIVAYPVHDSVIVRLKDEQRVRDVMNEVFAAYFGLSTNMNVLG